MRAPFVSFLLAGIVCAGAASADPSKEDVARADALFRAAQALLQAGQVSEACAKFGESYAIDPAPGALLNLGVCHDKEGKTASAYRELKQLAQAMSNSRNRDDKERLRFANETIAKIEPRLTRAAFDVPAGTQVKLDGLMVDTSQPQPIDPGDHNVELSAPGKVGKTTLWKVLPQPGTQVFKGDLGDATATPATPEAPAKGPEPAVAPPPQQPEQPRQKADWKRPAGFALGGAGVVAIGLGIYFGLDTFSKRDQRDPHCVGTVCDAEGISLNDKAHTSATISTIAFIGGAALLGAGGYLLLTAPRAKRTAAVRPTIGGLAVEGVF
jgi:hypothetical protein